MNHRAAPLYDARELGAAIRRARLSVELTQGELAQRLSVGRMTVSRMEAGDAVSMETVLRALSECGSALAVVPKFSRVDVQSEASSVSPTSWNAAVDHEPHHD